MKQKLAICTPINDTRFLGQWIKHISRYADMVFVYDDRTGGVVTERLRREKIVKYIHTNNSEPFHESRIRNMLWRRAVEFKIDWVLLLDVDEVMDDLFIRDRHKLMSDNTVSAYKFTWWNFWGNDRYVRIDKSFDPRWKMRVKLMRVYDLNPWEGRVQYGPNKYVIPDGMKIVDDYVYKCLHYGHIDEDMWNQKRETWKIAPKSLRKWWDGIGTEEDLKDVKLVDYNENFTAKEFIDKHIKKK